VTAASWGHCEQPPQCPHVFYRQLLKPPCPRPRGSAWAQHENAMILLIAFLTVMPPIIRRAEAVPPLSGWAAIIARLKCRELVHRQSRSTSKGTFKNCPAFRERNRSALRLLRVEGKGKERRMLTANEYRAEAKACRELADRAAEIYVKAALIELARDYDRAARQAERREHHLRVFGGSENTRAVA